MVSFPIKAFIGLGAVGVVGLGGYGIYAVSQKEEIIKDALIKKGFTFLDTTGTSDDGEWDKKVEEHKTNEGTPKLSGYTEQSTGEEQVKKTANRNNMKEICKKMAQESSNDADKLKQVEKWCTKNKTSP